MHRLQPVAHVRQGARGDDRHRVINVGLPHFSDNRLIDYIRRYCWCIALFIF